MKLHLPLLAAALLWSGTASAGRWIADSTQSRLGFVGIQGGTPFEGRFTRWNAVIDYDPAAPAAAKVTVDIDTASAATGDAQKDQSLPEAEWFDVKAFPKARFEATGFKPLGGGSFEASGTLTIRGMAKAVTLPFTLEIDGDRAKAKGRLNLVRGDFGVGSGQWASGDMVGLKVQVVVDMVAAAKR